MSTSKILARNTMKQKNFRSSFFKRLLFDLILIGFYNVTIRVMCRPVSDLKCFDFISIDIWFFVMAIIVHFKIKQTKESMSSDIFLGKIRLEVFQKCPFNCIFVRSTLFKLYIGKIDWYCEPTWTFGFKNEIFVIWVYMVWLDWGCFLDQLRIRFTTKRPKF